MSIGAAIACALVYWIVYELDTYAFLSWQCLQRPLVVGPIIGLVLGDLETGIVMSASLEAIFMGISAIGGSIPSDCLSGTIIAVAYAILIGGDDAVETGLALSLSIGTVMSSFNSMLSPVWAATSPYWEKVAAECKPRKFILQSELFTLVMGLPGAIVIFFGVAFGIEGLNTALAACPAWITTGLSAAGSMMTAVGFGILLSMIWSPEICVFYFVGFILSKSLGLSSLGIAVIGVAIAITLFFLERNIINAKNEVVSAGNIKVSDSAKSDEEDFF